MAQAKLMGSSGLTWVLAGRFHGQLETHTVKEVTNWDEIVRFWTILLENLSLFLS